MTPAAERYARAQELFEAVVDLSPHERVALLDERCKGDRALRQEVEALLDADAQTDSLDEQPFAIPPDVFDDVPEDQIAGRQFGPYEVVREIGRGGLGSVYLAIRSDGEYRKEVALKLIRRGLDTDDILRRFRNERQILAQLDHPNIARLIDGGTTDDGLPYFVMEYVKGDPITVYAEVRRLSTNARLELFRKVCAAVTYAHQNLVIHRDLKPSNILVNADGEPKLLDFGIAKLVAADDDIMLTQTAPGLRAMTPEYASPEQIKGERITTATDVYSLGVLLYELLTGTKPYRLKAPTNDEISRAITDQEPQRPSAVSASDRAALDSDLDNIVLMAMRKEPQRRYSSAAALAEDIRRYQEGLTVSARPRTFRYRAGKFIKRHRAGVAATALVLLAIVGGMVATLWQAGVARSERVRAEKRFNDVRKLANSYLFDVYPQIENLEGSLKARETIVRNALAYLDSLAGEAQGDSDLQGELATAYEKIGDVQGALNTSNLGNTKAGLASYEKARKLREAVLAEQPGSVAAKEKLANNYYITGRTLWNNTQTAEAEQAFERAIKLQRELIAAQPDSVAYKNRLATLLIDYGAIPAFNFQAEKAHALFTEALAILGNLQAQDPGNADLKKTRARCLRILSKAQTARGDYAGGLASLDEALTTSRELAAQFPQDFRLQRAVWLTQSMHCELYIDKRDPEQGVPSCSATIAFPDNALRHEPDNAVVAYDLAVSHFNTARAYAQAAQPEQAIAHSGKAIEVMSALSRKAPTDMEYQRNLAIYKTTMARAQLDLRQFDAAIESLTDVRQTLLPIVAKDPSVTTYQYDLSIAARLSAQAFHGKGEHAKAAGFADEAAAILRDLEARKSLRDSDKEIFAELEQEKAAYAAAANTAASR
jgi:eukaryotic-like serine/threonine-protein kinase